MNELTLLSRTTALSEAAAKYDADAILELNEKTEPRGLVLSPADALEAAHTRARALHENSRIEIGIGAVGKLIDAFSRSTFATQDDWAAIVNSITENFYYIKTETHDKISDNELIEFMFNCFENFCGGSTELLADQCEGLITKINGGYNADTEEAEYGEYADNEL
ncbi:MAG: hypothetical protein HFE63_05505 [Clostridiales bacterium]|nr:hypothetical protein [Clostridiales bacterium]